MTPDTIATALTDGQVDAAFDETLATWEDANAGAPAELRAWASSLRDVIVAHCQEIDDAEQLPATVAVQYIELKSQWIKLNTLINYRLMRLGTSDPECMVRASLLSGLLEPLEALIDAADLDRITELLSEPVAAPRLAA